MNPSHSTAAGETVGKIAGDPFAWVDTLQWHLMAHRSVKASIALGSWMSAALCDPNVSEAMKADIREWFSAGEPMETLSQALNFYRELAEGEV